MSECQASLGLNTHQDSSIIVSGRDKIKTILQCFCGGIVPFLSKIYSSEVEQSHSISLFQFFRFIRLILCFQQTDSGSKPVNGNIELAQSFENQAVQQYSGRILWVTCAISVEGE